MESMLVSYEFHLKQFVCFGHVLGGRDDGRFVRVGSGHLRQYWSLPILLFTGGAPSLASLDLKGQNVKRSRVGKA